jgi:hypothetical protein
MGKSPINLSQTIKAHIALYISVRAVSYQKSYFSIFLTHISRWALKNTTRLRNVNRLKAYIQSVYGALHKFT